MRFVPRKIADICQNDLRHFPILTVTGPRQSGKSTLLKNLLPGWRYVNLEEPSSLAFAQDDPAGFVKANSNQTIIDEIQRAPKLLSQIQVEVDRDRQPGRFALTGSHNLLLLQNISQSLAGRTAVRHLLPFSFGELNAENVAPTNLGTTLFRGGFPLVHSNPENANAWLDSYIETYVERDVRLIRNISDLSTFRRFLRLCAGRASQVLDLSGIGSDAGVSHNTVRDWINVLEAGFIMFRVEPFYENFSKRIIKSPKLYFYDTGILCRILNIRNESELMDHPFRGHVFENWCVVEKAKEFMNRGERPRIYFWRDQKNEVDLLVEKSPTEMDAFECKSAATIVGEFLDAPKKLAQIMKNKTLHPQVIYGGDESQFRSDGSFVDWKSYALRDY